MSTDYLISTLNSFLNFSSLFNWCVCVVIVDDYLNLGIHQKSCPPYDRSFICAFGILKSKDSVYKIDLYFRENNTFNCDNLYEALMVID